MDQKKIGISRDLIFHPGETVADVLEDREITQAELATRAGVTPAYVSSVLSGKKGISANFAMALEYALGVPKSFWLNLQANYEAELLEANEAQTVTEDERRVRADLKDVVSYLRKRKMIPTRERVDDSILSLRKFFQISNIANLQEIVPSGAFRISSETSVNRNVLGAWLRLCQLSDNPNNITTKFNKSHVENLIVNIKKIMCKSDADIFEDLKEELKDNGIDFCVVRNFKGAPVQGYIHRKDDGIYRMVLTIRGSYADIFWFSLFHEIGHIVNGDVTEGSKFIDDGCNAAKERKADLFAENSLLDSVNYNEFVNNRDFSIETISKYAYSQGVMPYIVIGRLQREGHIDYRAFSNYKLRYKWADEQSYENLT